MGNPAPRLPQAQVYNRSQGVPGADHIHRYNKSGGRCRMSCPRHAVAERDVRDTVNLVTTTGASLIVTQFQVAA